MIKNKILVFTVNFNEYDTLAPISKEPGADYLCFTDSPEIKTAGWDNIHVDPKENFLKESRRIKICPHLYVDGYGKYIYVDANMTTNAVVKYAERYFVSGMLAQVHSQRDCIYKEAKQVIALKKEDPGVISAQIRKYIADGMPGRYGLFANGFFIRDNSFNAFCEKWYNEIDEGSYRDQISLSYCIWKYKPKNFSAIQSFMSKRNIQIRPHVKVNTIEKQQLKEVARPNVLYFVPGRGDKNLGKAYNDHCALAGKDDWICIMDGDIIFLNPYWSRQIEDIIIKHGKKYPLISCMTNRLGLEWQLPYGFSEDPNILNHAKIADKHFDLFYDEVIPSPKQTAGLFMLFPKSTWDKVKFVPGLTNGGTFVDFSFANSVMQKLGTIGIAKGIYVFHFYRFNRKNKRDIDHLL